MTEQVLETITPETLISTFVLHEVISVQETQDEGHVIVTCDVTGYDGTRGITVFGLVPNDNEGYSPVIRQWLIDHVGEYEIIPYVYVPPIPVPYNIAISSLWTRMTDDEAEGFDTAMSTATPLRLRKAFNAASSITSETELFLFVKGVLDTSIGPARAVIVLAQ